MAIKKKWLGMLAIMLVFGMAVIGCDNGNDTNTNNSNGNVNGNDTDTNSNTGNDNSDQELPAASGINAVGGMTYYQWEERTVFSETNANDASGTYTVHAVANGVYGLNEKYSFDTEVGTGTYTWNEETKTVTLKPDKVAFWTRYSSGDSYVEHDYGALRDRNAYRAEWQAMMNEWSEGDDQEAINEWLSTVGFSSVTALIDFRVNEAFANRTNAYSFSEDGAVLFFERALPANKGVNELSGQTFGGNNSDINWVFTSTGVTYAYDSIGKTVWARWETVDGKNMMEYFTEQTTPPANHHMPDDNAFRAAATNGQFGGIISAWYNSTSKTIGRYDD